MDFAQHIIEMVERSHGPSGLAILAACAFLEYLFPPFPGDLVVVFGAFLVTNRGWSAPGVFGAVLVGSMLGFMLAFFVGKWLHKSEARWVTGRLARARPKIDRLVDRFSRHGALYIAINRFLPSVRALFFVAAGMAQLSPWKVLAFGALSAALWNAMLFALGATVGKEWSSLHRIFLTYGKIAWILLAALGLILLARWLWRRRASAR
jgi:membrane protein DedA with SNARE-associated domain